jgi:hypothetical protein
MGELKAPIGPNTAHLCIDMQRLFQTKGLAYGLDAARDTQSRAARRALRSEQSSRALSLRRSRRMRLLRWRAYYEKWCHVTRQTIENDPYRSKVPTSCVAPRRGADCRAARLWPSRQRLLGANRDHRPLLLGERAIDVLEGARFAALASRWSASSNSSRQTLARKG